MRVEPPLRTFFLTLDSKSSAWQTSQIGTDGMDSKVTGDGSSVVAFAC